ncbi:MAG: peptidylprolyl isomerase [Janthinobacterium lividum]
MRLTPLATALAAAALCAQALPASAQPAQPGHDTRAAMSPTGAPPAALLPSSQKPPAGPAPATPAQAAAQGTDADAEAPPAAQAGAAQLGPDGRPVPFAAGSPPLVGLPPGDPVLASVDGHEIRMSDLTVAAESLPQQLRGMPKPVLYPMLLDQLIDRQAVVIEAKKEGLDKTPEVQDQLRRAEDTTLQNAVLTREVTPKISEEAIKAKYDADYANKPGEEEVHARHILVDSEDKAKDIIKQLKGGADFEKLAKQDSKDPGAQNGGDLGWFKKGDMLPEFSTAAFAMKTNEFTQEPIHTRYGWHVIQVLGTRTAPPVDYAQAHDEIRQTLVQNAVKAALEKARAQVKVQRFTVAGASIKPGEQAPAAEGVAPAQPPAAAK